MRLKLWFAVERKTDYDRPVFSPICIGLLGSGIPNDLLSAFTL